MPNICPDCFTKNGDFAEVNWQRCDNCSSILKERMNQQTSTKGTAIDDGTDKLDLSIWGYMSTVDYPIIRGKKGQVPWQMEKGRGGK